MYTRFIAKCSLALVTGLFFMACQDDPEPNPSFKVEVRAYNELTNDFALTSATLTITSENEVIVTKELNAETATIEIQKKDSYTVKITKATIFLMNTLLAQQNFNRVPRWLSNCCLQASTMA